MRAASPPCRQELVETAFCSPVRPQGAAVDLGALNMLGLLRADASACCRAMVRTATRRSISRSQGVFLGIRVRAAQSERRGRGSKMGRKRRSPLREIFAGWTGLDWSWLTLLIVGAIGVGVLDGRDPPNVASAAPSPPSVQRTAALAIIPIVWEPRPPTRSKAPAGPVLAGETAADAGNSEDPLTGAVSIPAAPQSHTGSSPVAPLPEGPIHTLPHAATGNPAASSAVPENRGAEAPTNSGAHPVGQERVVIHYLAGSPGADAAAKLLSTRLGVHAEMREEATVPPSALIRYVSSEDHSTARKAGKILGEMDYAWRIETAPDGPGDSPQGVIKIWLPNR